MPATDNSVARSKKTPPQLRTNTEPAAAVFVQSISFEHRDDGLRRAKAFLLRPLRGAPPPSTPDRTALRDVSFALFPNEMTVLLGSEDCGKTELLELLAGHHRMQSGRVILGHPFSSAPLPSRMVSFVQRGEPLQVCHLCLVAQ